MRRPDVVEYEATRRQDLSDANRIKKFLSKHRDRVDIEDTSFAALLTAIRKDRGIPLPADAGEISIYGFIRNMRHQQPGLPTLVLFEDAWFQENEARPRNVHLVSLVAFLKGLQDVYPEFLASQALEQITHSRPHVNHADVDDPAESGTERKSTLRRG